MNRFQSFWWYQVRSWRRLFAIRRKTVVLHAPIESSHPSSLCLCLGFAPNHQAAINIDHQPECPWLSAMCKSCGGTGWCHHCSGDGCEPRGQQAVPILAD